MEMSVLSTAVRHCALSQAPHCTPCLAGEGMVGSTARVRSQQSPVLALHPRATLSQRAQMYDALGSEWLGTGASPHERHWRPAASLVLWIFLTLFCRYP